MMVSKMRVTYVDGCWYVDGHLAEPAFSVDAVVKYYVCTHYMLVLTIDDIHRLAMVEGNIAA